MSSESWMVAVLAWSLDELPYAWLYLELPLPIFGALPESAPEDPWWASGGCLCILRGGGEDYPGLLFAGLSGQLRPRSGLASHFCCPWMVLGGRGRVGGGRPGTERGDLQRHWQCRSLLWFQVGPHRAMVLWLPFQHRSAAPAVPGRCAHALWHAADAHEPWTGTCHGSTPLAIAATAQPQEQRDATDGPAPAGADMGFHVWHHVRHGTGWRQRKEFLDSDFGCRKQAGMVGYGKKEVYGCLDFARRCTEIQLSVINL
ncbi:unnamed protein product [Durusdinium trenchii]|uniref:Uncharacterized protein n=1 Tax=Durusdinium trenchii TaxID=1381693 RepID=A0ABP0QRD9_9DINO